jgi:hypothetical protein
MLLLINRKKYYLAHKLPPFLHMAPKTTKTFEKDPFWRNIPKIPLSHVIFQLKKKKNLKSKKF